MAVRKTYAPYSTSGENVAQTPLTGFIDIKQEVIPTIETGFVNENGLWIGNKSSDEVFSFYQKDEEIANGGTIITDAFDMTGFRDVQVALKPTNGGNYAMTAAMGSSGPESYANLRPLDDAATLIGNEGQANPNDFSSLFVDNAQALTANVWNIFYIGHVLRNQKLLMFSIVNNSGDISTIESTFLRIV